MNNTDKIFMTSQIVLVLAFISFSVAQCSRSAECKGKGGVLIQGGFHSSCVKMERIE